jgi:type-F conjugative transfer system pilin assembly protein TrbC
MLFSLRITFCIGFLFCGVLAEADDLKTAIQEMQTQASQQALQSRREMESLAQQMREAVEKEPPFVGLNQAMQPSLKEGGSCTTGSLNGHLEKGGCASFNAKPLIQHNTKESPLLAHKKPLIFVSSSMPVASLKILAHQAKEQGAILVIRGMVKDSMVETAKLVDEINHPLDIDPKLFEQFEVIQVPTFLIFKRGRWHKMRGNVDLNFANQKAGAKDSKVP